MTHSVLYAVFKLGTGKKRNTINGTGYNNYMLATTIGYQPK